MNHQNGYKGWLRNAIAIVLAGFILVSPGMSSVGAAQAQIEGDAVSWEYLLDFSDPDPESAARQASSLAPDLISMGIDSDFLTLDALNYRLALTGGEGLEQLRQVLYSQQMAGFLGGAAELEINMPVASLEAVSLNLESNLSTGYQWRLVSSEGVSFIQAGEPAFTSRSPGYGTTSMQTLVLQPETVGNGSIRLEYRRSFEPDETATRRLRLDFAAQAVAIDLSDPNPAVIDVTASSDENPIADIRLDKSLPASWDWRTKGIVPAVRDQGSCGSCWAFGTVSVMESAVKKGGGPLKDLSEQFLISCNNSGWDCGGGLTATKYHYNTKGKNQTAVGAVLESAKPYTATNGSCTVAYSHPYKASNWAFITGSEWTMPTVDQIKKAIYTYGPVTAGVCADSGWNGYSGGVYNPSSNQCGGSTNHQIVLVGWNDANSTWILRNSWGPGWGDNGYMHIRWDTTGTKSRVGEGTSWVKYVGAASTVPTLKSPAGTVTDKTPTYKWTPVTGATKYQYQLMKGTTSVYTKIVNASVCTSSLCSNTPTTTLSLGAYKWKARAMVGGAWKAYSAYKNFTVAVPTTGFNSQFNGSAAGWSAVNGTWTAESTFYSNAGNPTGSSHSTRHTGSYPTLTYEARLKRSVCPWCANRLIIRGTPSPLDPSGTWNSQYLFQYTNDDGYNMGYFSVWKIKNGVSTMLHGWTTSSYINPYGWNTLKVTAKGSALKYYINGHLVWSGTDTGLTTGAVGIGMYQDYTSSTMGKLFVDWAKLSTSVGVTAMDEVISPFEPKSGGDINGYFEE